MRRTKLSFDELLKEFNNPDLEYGWKLLHLEEIGAILLLKDGENTKKAEAFFRDLLDGNNLEEFRIIAIRNLAALDCMDRETYDKLIAFPGKSFDNRRIYVEAGDLMI